MPKQRNIAMMGYRSVGKFIATPLQISAIWSALFRALMFANSCVTNSQVSKTLPKRLLTHIASFLTSGKSSLSIQFVEGKIIKITLVITKFKTFSIYFQGQFVDSYDPTIENSKYKISP